MNEPNKIVEDYNSGLTINQLIKKYHRSFYTIKNILISNNVEFHSQKNIDKKILTKEQENIIIDNYVNKQYGLIKSGKEVGIGKNIVKKVLHKHNIPVRNLHDSIILRNENERKYTLNENFFATETPEMAYILGFLAADGCVRKNYNGIKITLARKDKELIEKIRNILMANSPIKDTITSKGYDISTFEINSKIIKSDLAKYGIVPNKTFTFTFPTNLNKLYWRDFIRGYFDGDGTICMSGKSLRFSICSAVKSTLKQIIDFFEEEGISPVSIYERNNEGKNTLYYFQYSTNSVKKIYDILYYDNCLCLKRKYEIYTELVK